MNFDEYIAIADALKYFKENEAYDEETFDGIIDALVEPLGKHYPDFDYVQFLNDTDKTEAMKL